MKNMINILMIGTLIVFLGSAVNAQGVGQDEKKAAATNVRAGGKFVDQNKDGICDNFEARGQAGRGAGFTDKDGDGKCDHFSARKGPQGNCNGQGYQHRHGGGKCCPQGQGNGQGCRYRNGGNSQGAAPSISEPGK